MTTELRHPVRNRAVMRHSQAMRGAIPYFFIAGGIIAIAVILSSMLSIIDQREQSRAGSPPKPATASVPVQYPADWPLEYVRAPEGALATESTPGSENEVLPGVWFVPEKEVGRAPHENMVTSWVMLYSYDGKTADGVAMLESELAGRGWIRSDSSKDGYNVYYSTDYMYCIYFLHKDELTSLGEPYKWHLEIQRYEKPVDYLDQAKGEVLE